MHKTVARILNKLELSNETPPIDCDTWNLFLDVMSGVMEEHYNKMAMIENAMSVSTREMDDLNKQLKLLSVHEKYLKEKQIKKTEAEKNKLFGMLKATFDCSEEGILIVNHTNGNVEQCNKKFAELWRIPDEVISEQNDEKMLQLIRSQLKDPDQFLQKVKELYAKPEAKCLDTVKFKDGRIYERKSAPLYVDDKIVGRVWFFLDKTTTLKNVLPLKKKTTKRKKTKTIKQKTKAAS